MEVIFGHEGGWNGGQWTYNGFSRRDFIKTYGFDPTVVEGMTGIVKLPDRTCKIVVSPETFKVSGVDHDHGHEYSWSYEEPSFLLEEIPIPIPASVLWKQNGIITLEMS